MTQLTTTVAPKKPVLPIMDELRGVDKDKNKMSKTTPTFENSKTINDKAKKSKEKSPEKKADDLKSAKTQKKPIGVKKTSKK